MRDKAAALEVYYRQARNLEAERKAANVRLRAERRAGELLLELKRADLAKTGKAARDKQLGLSNDAITPSPFATALESTGIDECSFKLIALRYRTYHFTEDTRATRCQKGGLLSLISRNLLAALRANFRAASAQAA